MSELQHHAIIDLTNVLYSQKRYERLIKAYKLDAAPAKSDKVESGDENEAAQAPKKRKAPAKSRPSPAKKVKTGANTDEDPKEGEGSDGMIDPKLDNGIIIPCAPISGIC